MRNGCIYDEKGLAISFQLEIFFSNAEWFDVGLRQSVSVSNHMCQRGTCFMEDGCSFIWVCGSLLWIHMVLLTPNHVEIQCFGLMFSTADQWEVKKK